MAPSQNTRVVKTSDTVFGIVESLDSGEARGVTEIAAELDKAPSTVHKHLTTLVEMEYLVREGRKYKMGLKFFEKGVAARNEFPLYPLASDSIEELAETTGEVVWVIVEEHGYGVHIMKAVGSHGVQTHGALGKRAHLHHLAAGKAILAHLPDDRVSEILDQHGLEAQTEHTITTREGLESDLADIRERGYACNDQETVEGLQSVGAPILLDQDRPVGALCVCGPARRMVGDRLSEEIPEALLGATNEIELRLTY